ncbi:restriction endonuclease subunit S [Halomonas korlensis]|uniref:Type I restriction enzyme, S subunit n=1 Tax=Halomonas korlensis TaxID=463301 RepID=A0A1I7GKJ3_9GAMM|nr:restriction endonuclease subunit S [Halomonas korlensis]SFU48953.1 type I restriction enzyme, S subunit [Halomonas korlensis]
MVVQRMELPEGWTLCDIAGVTDSVEKLDPRSEPDRLIAYIDISSIDNQSNNISEGKPFLISEAPSRARQIVKQGDVLFSLVRPYLRNIALVTPEFDGEVASTGFSVLRPSKAIDHKFLYYKVTSKEFVDLVSGEQYGVSYPAVKDKQVRAHPVALPPINEQRRIVDKIESLFAQLDHGEAALRNVQKLLVRYRQSVLKAAVTGQLTADWRADKTDHLEHGHVLLERILQTRRENLQGRGKYKEPVAPDTSNLPALPEGWVWASVDQLHTHLTSGSRAWKKYYGSGDGVFIMAQNVRPMRFDLSEKFLVDPPQDSPDAVRSEVRKDDVLITIVGANTGDVCRFPSDVGRHYVCQSVALLRLADAALSPFIETFLASKGAGRDQLEKFIYGAGRPHLSFEQLRTVVVPMPPLGEQTEIMQRVSGKLDEIKQIDIACQAELTRSAALRQSILKEAFAGKLVPQDPNDEPADELLARIKAARAAETQKTRKKATA